MKPRGREGHNGPLKCPMGFLVQQNIQSDKTDELSHQILNITSFDNGKDKILSQFSLRQLARHVEPSKNIYRGWSGSK